MKQKVISMWSQKGGVGKTTTTINVAACLAMVHKLNVVVADINFDQPDAMLIQKLSGHSLPFEVVAGRPEHNDFDILIADHQSNIKQLPGGDLTVIPMRPMAFDFASSKRSVLKLEKKGIPYIPLVTQFDVRRSDDRKITKRFRDLFKGVVVTHERSIYGRQANKGETVFTAGSLSGASDARAEIELLTEQILKRLKN